DQKEAFSLADKIALVNDGKIVQTATPREIHRKPLNTFVAGFMGDTNFLNATVVDVSGKKARLVTDMSGLVINSNHAYRGLKKGAKVTASIRPETLFFESGKVSGADFNKFEVLIKDKVYMGSYELYRVDMSGTGMIMTEINPFKKRNKNSTETVYVHPGDVVILEKQSL
ncbi:MAG: hypothetical protein JXA66_01530, partial [Oligoflexia bacterium]|nr:hypothetical protein [Oligoflexia bacterium]